MKVFRLTLIGLCLLSLAFLASCGSGTNTAEEKSAGVVSVGSKNFTEQLILGELMAQLIEGSTNLEVKRVFNLGGTMICHNALKQDDLDLYAEYTGTALKAILKRDVISDPDMAYDAVESAYRKQFTCEWLKPFGFNNTYAITIRKDFAEKHGIETISDLEQHAGDMAAGFTAEFMDREDGYPGLKEKYGFSFNDTKDMEPSLMYKAIAQKEVEVISAFATDGRIAIYDLKMLKDDKGLFPPYYAAPVVRMDTLKAHPELEGVLEKLSGLLDDKTMMNLNNKVDAEQREPKAVAREFLQAEGLLK